VASIVTTKSVTHHALVCDGGCGATFTPGRDPGDTHDTSLMDVRAQAWAEGWRFPSQRARKDLSKMTRQFDDVCPACITDWVPRTITGQKITEVGG
jgi:hypothetical protein